MRDAEVAASGQAFSFDTLSPHAKLLSCSGAAGGPVSCLKASLGSRETDSA